MDSTQGAQDHPAAATLAVEPRRGLALLEHGPDRVVFEGIALGPGVYVDAAGRRVRVGVEQLPLVADRMRGVFVRDLHREDMGASVGVVVEARVEEGEVRFTGDVRLAPYVAIVREFWPHVRFSLGFRYDPSKLVQGEDETYDLPPDFLIDHLAIVPQGQYPNARLVRLLNQAHVGLPAQRDRERTRSGAPQGADVKAGAEPTQGQPQGHESGAPQGADVSGAAARRQPPWGRRSSRVRAATLKGRLFPTPCEHPVRARASRPALGRPGGLPRRRGPCAFPRAPPLPAPAQPISTPLA